MKANTLKKLEKYRKQVEEFNTELKEYAKVTGSYDLPIIDSTVIGFEPLEPYEIKDKKNGFDVIADGITMKVRTKQTDDNLEVITGWSEYYDGVKESIAYDRKRLKKGWRVWKAENPDAELEKDEEEN